MTKSEEKKAQFLMEMRCYQEIRRCELEGIVEFVVKALRREEMILIWCTSERVGVTLLRKMIDKMNDLGVKRGMIIADLGITAGARTLAGKKRIESIPKDFPSFNIFEHDLVPLHEILTEEEKEVILRKYRVNVYDMPRISRSDPAVVAVGGRSGDLIKIIRNSPTAGKHVFYRYVG